MKLKVLTHNGSYNLGSDFCEFLYPSSSLKIYCYSIELEVGVSKSSKEDQINTYAGDLKKPIPEINGQSKKQKFLEKIDHANKSQYKHKNGIQDRLHWKNKASIPQVHQTPKLFAPIKPSTTMTSHSIRSASKAMAIGIVAQKARSQILTKVIKLTINEVANKVKTKHPNSKSAVLVASIYYLKANPDYGRAPNLRGVYFDGLIDYSKNIIPYNYVEEKIKSLCGNSNSLKSDFEIYNEIIDFNNLNNRGAYDTASLFVLCEW
ncbi:hypothetical protein [Photobacterium nomapromontoriensis]|uniref:hypothetical protein n=1 Tax=Photobacterium nomapromontoriensis TaxID=2910237 RepID=UPI003D11F213